jgi:fatty-acyl-CoA synthase
MIQYTSGTTGFPKGARLHHRGLTNNARFFAARAGVRPGDAWLTAMPLFHTAGCAMCALGTVQNRGRLILLQMFDPAAMLRLVAAEKANVLTGVPTMMVAMLEAQAREPHDASSLRIAISGGSMVAPELVRKVTSAFGCSFGTVYGQTEASPVVTQHHVGDSIEDLAYTVGQPLPQTAISIRSVTDNRIVPCGEVGEICIHGYCRMLGYNDDPEATGETIDAEGWLHTGDLGTMDARGYVTVTGRVKEMIIRGGENLFPAEIENALLEHPAVAECAVVGLPDETWGEIVACFLRPAEGAEVSADDLRRHCREQLAPQKTPQVWVRTESFPLTGSGKIRKFALRDAWLSGDLRTPLAEPA